LGKCVYWVGSSFPQNPLFVMGISFIKTMNSALYPTHFAYSQLKFLKCPCVS